MAGAALLLALAFAAFMPARAYARTFYLEANPYDHLSVPTQITRFGQDFFIADVYHDQILTSKSGSAPIKNWKVMANGLNGPHGIAWDGEIYMVVDRLSHWPSPSSS